MLSLEGSSTSTKGNPSETADVIDLPGPEMGESGIVDAILRHCANELVECPVIPPMCPKAKLAVSRERRVVQGFTSRLEPRKFFELHGRSGHHKAVSIICILLRR